MLKIFGIRHHGPGSARNLASELAKYEPDIVLLEGPADAQEALAYFGHEGLVPPVALLLYNPKELRQASWFPFADFSPEWVAMKYALEHKIPFWNIDLPMGLKFVQKADDEHALTEDKADELEKEDPEALATMLDPIGTMARLAGYSDSERWWETTFENAHGQEDVFEAVALMMRTLRTEINVPESPETLRREAHMRQGIRKAQREMYQRIAVVCGAWHLPALEKPADFTVKQDEKLLKGLKPVKTAVTWVPWSFDRLSTSSGYGAGIVSPAWYRYLFQNPEEAVTHWMVDASRLLRAEDLETGAAHSIEAVKLAEGLSAMRSLPLPGIEELKESAISVLCHGNANYLQLIEKKLIVGELTGEVPDTIPMIPLQADITALAKSLRLDLYGVEAKDLQIDLREEAGMKKSVFLHRMRCIEIHFGELKQQSGRELSTKNEYWKVQWKPEYSLSLIEKGMWGNSLEVAAMAISRSKAREEESLSGLAKLLHVSLLAQLNGLVPEVVELLKDKAALTHDVKVLMQSLPDFSAILRYSDVRGTDQAALRQIVSQLIPRICVALPPISINASDNEAAAIHQLILSCNQSIQSLNEPDWKQIWLDSLSKLALTGTVHPLLAGGCLRMAFDQKQLTEEILSQQMAFALSEAQGADKAGSWLEGFLHGSGALLLLHPRLLSMIDEWVNMTSTDAFQRLMPILRRSFSGFTKPEKQKILTRVVRGELDAPQDHFQLVFDVERARPSKTVLGRLF